MSLSFLNHKATILNTNDTKTFVFKKVSSQNKWVESSFNIHKFYNYQLDGIESRPISTFVENHTYNKYDCVKYNSNYYICNVKHYSTEDDIHRDTFGTNTLSEKYWEDYTSKINNIKINDYILSCQKYTNDLKYSENTSNDLWCKTNIISKLEYANNQIISPRLNSVYAYNMLLKNDESITDTRIFQLHQSINVHQNQNYKFSTYIKNADNKLQYIGLSLFHNNSNIGYSVIFDLYTGTKVDQHIINSKYEIQNSSYVQSTFNNMNYLIEYLDDNHTEMRLTIMADILLDGIMEARINFVNKDDNNNIIYKWKPEYGLYKTYGTCFQISASKLPSVIESPKYISTTTLSKSFYAIHDIYLKSSTGYDKQDINLHIFKNQPYITEDAQISDIGLCSSVVNFDSGIILGNKDPYGIGTIQYTYGVKSSWSYINAGSMQIYDISYITRENKAYSQIPEEEDIYLGIINPQNFTITLNDKTLPIHQTYKFTYNVYAYNDNTIRNNDKQIVGQINGNDIYINGIKIGYKSTDIYDQPMTTAYIIYGNDKNIIGKYEPLRFTTDEKIANISLFINYDYFNTYNSKYYIHPLVSQKKDKDHIEYLFHNKENNIYYFKNKNASYEVLMHDKYNSDKNKKAMLNAITFTDSLYNSNGKVITSYAFNSH